MNGIKALVFDVFGTVVDWRSGIVRAGEELGARNGLDADWADFADRWRGRYVPSMNRVRTGESGWKNLDTLHRESLEELLAEFGLESLSEAEKGWFTKAWHRLDAWPDSVDGLRLLRREHIIAPLSNGNVALLTSMAKRAGLPWDLILSAELVRHYKPDPETYLLMPTLFDLAPEEVMMVAAHPSDLTEAAGHGLRTAYVHRPLEFGPDMEVRWPDGDFDVEVESIIRLADALK
ncbi:haloacid dehalogenase type II [Rubrobacter indicoceani]|uniref:haloacid dehalogenase type II n=1 Tax=Rubrobacter indicoceani TaxID=2051957 RepID=UPI000E5A776D|nr:haloacid dehalogenase type II [Rubrobacter indicoceani]